MSEKFTVAGFYAFCRSKPPDQVYRYVCGWSCPLATYAKNVLGYQGQSSWDHPWNQLTNESAEARLCDFVASEKPYTYGDLADRIYRKVLL